MIEEKGFVEYEINSISDCEHPDCSSRYSYGTRVYVREDKTLYDLIRLRGSVRCKEYCPKHTEDEIHAQEAKNMEHEKAIEEWENKKRIRREREYNDILSSEFMPIFRLYSECIVGPNKRFKYKCSSFDEAVDSISDFDIPCDVLLVDDRNLEYAVIGNKGRVKEHKSCMEGDEADYEALKNQYGQQEFRNRDFYPIRTNSLTGMSDDKPVHKFEEFIDEIIEWREYTEYQGSLVNLECPLCSRAISSPEFSRALIDGEEKIIISCREYPCNGNIAGNLNQRYVSDEEYDLGS